VTDTRLEADYDVLANARGTMPEIAADWFAASEQASEDLAGKQTISYGGDDGLAYDVIRPEGSPRGAVIFLHGGFWVQGNKDSVLFPHANFTKAGLYYVAVTYGLAPRYTLDELVANVEAAAQSFGELAPLLGIDIGRVALIGHSAGAYLAAALVISERRPFRPLGSLLVSGLFDLRAIRNLNRIEKVGLSEADAERLTIDGTALAGEGEVILAIGSREPAGFQLQTATLAQELRQGGASPQTIVGPDCDHFSIAREMSEPGSELAKAVLRLFA